MSGSVENTLGEDIDCVVACVIYDEYNRAISFMASIFTMLISDGDKVGFEVHGELPPSYSFDYIPRIDIMAYPDVSQY